MSLMPWDEEEKKDESNTSQIASVQSAWQPSLSGANSAVATDDTTRQSYLMSDEKAKSDEERRIRQAREAEARRIAAANAALASRQQQQQQTQQQQTNEAPNVDDAARQQRLAELRAQRDQENKGIGGFFRRNIADTFDANSTQDRIHRLEAQAPEMFQEEQNITARDNVQSVATNPFKRIYEDLVEAPRRVGTALARNTGDAKDSTAAQENATRIENEAIAKAKSKLEDPNVSDEEKMRWYNFLVKMSPQIQQAQYDRAIQMAKDAKDDDPLAVAAAFAEMGLDIGTLGMGGVAFKGAKTAARQGTKQFGKYLGKNVLKPVLPAAGAGGIGAVTSQGSDVTPQQIALGTAAGSALGLAFPLAGAGTGRLFRPFKPSSLTPTKGIDGAIAPPGAPVRVPEPVLNGGISETSSLLPMNRNIDGADVGDVTPIKIGEDSATTESFSPIREEAKTLEPAPAQDYSRSIAEPNKPDAPLTPKESTLLAKLNEQKTSGELSPELETVRQRLQARNDAIASTPEVTPVPATAPAKIVPAADGTAQTPVLPTEQVKTLQDSKVGKSQAEEAEINQKLQELDPDTPSIKTTDTAGVDDPRSPVLSWVEDGKPYYQRIAPEDYDRVAKTLVDNNAAGAANNRLNNVDGTPYHITAGDAILDRGTEIKGSVNADDLAESLGDGAGKSVDTSNLPSDMSGESKVDGKAKIPPKKKGFEQMMMKSNDPTLTKQRIAEAVGLKEDGASDLAEILRESNVSPKQAQKILDIYNEIEKIADDNAKIQKQNRKNYKGGKSVDDDINKIKNRDTRREQLLQQQLESELKKVQRQGSKGERVTQIIENITAGRLANMLSSTGNVSRNLMQEIGADIIGAIKNPILTARSITKNGNLLKHEVQRSANGWKTTPKTVSEGYKYILGNTYKTAMTPVSAGQRARVGGMRTELTKWAMKEIEGRNLTSAQAETLSRTLSNHTEAMANTLAGVDNGMVSSVHAMKTLRAWKKWVQTAETSELLKFEGLVERQSTLASKMMKGIFEGETKKGRIANAMLSNVFPYVRTAWNLASTGVTRNLNPVSKSVLDQIRADQLSGGRNTVNILKNKLVDYGLLTGAAMLVADNVIVYNDGDEIDQPRGISIKIGDNEYVPVRATPIEFPLALTVAATRIAEDVASGDVRDPSYYGKIVSGSVPYIDAFDQTTGAIESVSNLGGKEGDGGYAAKSYGINTAKSLVPWSNNGIYQQVKAAQGESLNAKTSYDKDPVQWFKNAVGKSYSPAFYDSLKDSRDNAGRVRTVDNQGVIINKTINDANTSEFNDRVSNLVEYGRKNGLGKATQDMFNTYDTGKNNNFKSVQDSITFLDAVDGKPDNTKKLEKNEKYTALAQQIRDAFYGGDASELLTLDGKNLYSDVSVPNKNGTKNSSLPISMQSITNAIAATDLPAEQRDRMYEISKANTALYDKFKAKEMTYDQYSAAKAKNEEEYTSILSNSEGFKQLSALMDELDSTGFFEADGLGSTRSGQTYLWNALNAMLGSKGKTPAANYPETDKGWNSWGGGGGSGLGGAPNIPGITNQGVKWTPVQARQMAKTKKGTYTPLKATIKLGNAVKKDKTQNYTSRTF